MFLSLRLLNLKQEVMSNNLYWLADEKGTYSGLQQMNSTDLDVKTRKVSPGKIEVLLTNPASKPVAFFNRLALVEPQTKKRILPVFYDNNYVSVLPGEQKTVTLEFTENKNINPVVSIEGWNVKEQLIEVK
jgi:hypothetical protein